MNRLAYIVAQLLLLFFTLLLFSNAFAHSANPPEQTEAAQNSSTNIYILQDSDVRVENGVLEKCEFLMSNRFVVVPKVLHGQTIREIGAGAFYRTEALSIELPETIEKIGGMAFSEGKIERMVLPEKLTYIGHEAFFGCPLKKIVIPEATSFIGKEAFHDCQLDSVIIKSKELFLSEFAFYSCPISYLKIEEGLKRIRKQAFLADSKSTLNELILPKSVNFIGEEAFAGNPLQQIEMPGVDSICSRAFRGCKLNAITLPSTLNYIESSAFQDVKVTSIRIPRSLQTIGAYAFAGMDLEEVIFEEGVKIIGSSSFAWNKIETLIIPKSVELLYYRAFEGNKLTKVEFSPNTNLIVLEGEAFADNPLEFVHIGTIEDPLFNGLVSHYGTTMNGDLTITDFSASYGTRYLPYTLKDEDVKMNNGMIIGASFPNKYKQIIIPEILHGKEVKGIADPINGCGIFSCPLYFENNRPAEVVDRPNYLQKGHFKLPPTLETIGSWCFAYNAIDNIELPPNLKTIGRNAFFRNNLNSIHLPNSVVTIGDSAFFENAILNVTLSANLTKIEYGVFMWNSIEKITIPKNISVIQNEAFGLNALTKLEFEEGSKLEYIGVRAFYGNQIDSLKLPSNIQCIDERAFRKNKLEFVDLSSCQQLRSIKDRAFWENESLKGFTLPESDLKKFQGWASGESYSTLSPGTFVEELHTYYYADIKR